MQGVDELTIVVEPYIKRKYVCDVSIEKLLKLLGKECNIGDDEIKSLHITKQYIEIEVGK